MWKSFLPVSDVYALGATLYFLLHGKRPVSAVHRASGTELMISEQLSQEIKEIINASMMVSKRERSKSVSVFINSMQQPAANYDDEATIIVDSQHIKQEKVSSINTDNMEMAVYVGMLLFLLFAIVVMSLVIMSIST